MNPTRIVIHHSATLPGVALEEIRQAHLDRGFDDIGYHYLITQHGEVLRGRPEHIQGAHAFGLNLDSIGICCVGNFDDSEIPPSQWNGLLALVCEIALRHQIEPAQIIGHCDVSSLSANATTTRCPGKYLHARLEMLRTSVALCSKPDYRGSAVSMEPTKDGFTTLRGVLKGRQFQRALEGCPDGINWVRIALRASGDEGFAWQVRALLAQGAAADEERAFVATVPQSLLKEGRYELKVYSDGEDEHDEDAANLAHMQFPVELPIHATHNYCVPPMRAHVVTERLKGTGPFVVGLRGVVVNTGSMPWINNNDRTPFRVGAIVFKADGQSAPVIELRYDLPFSRIEVGQEVPFSFTFDVGELPLGEYYAHVDMLRERCYWFTQLGSVGDSIRIVVSEQRKDTSRDTGHLLNPPNSWAASPEMSSLLYIAPTLPLFDRSTGGRRLLDIFRSLRKQGVKITFLYEQLGAFGDTKKYTDKLDELGVEHSTDPLGYLTKLDNRRSFHLVVLGWYYTAAAVMATVRDVLPHARVAVDSIDIEWAREARAEQCGMATKALQERERAKAKERRVYAQADEVWVVSEDEAAILSQELPAVKWRVVGIPCPINEAFVEQLKGDKVLFVGGFGHPPNESAAIWAAKIVGEFNGRHRQSIKLDIVGAQPPSSVLALAKDSNISVHGFVNSLDEVHRQAKIFLAPLQYGGGVKGKISDAICRGIPVITNALGNEGLGLKHGTEILLGETTEDFVKLLSDVYAGRYDLDSIRRNALEKVQNLWGDDAINAQILSAIVAPHVVVGIVTYNQRDLLRACINSVLAKTSYQNFTLAVISNGCSDGTQEMLRELSCSYPNIVDVYCSDTNDFFVRPCNQIINKYPESDVVLMNNDVEVINSGWLTNLIDAAYSSRLVCGSGGLVFDAEGLVSEAGAEIYASGLGRNLYRGAPLIGGAALAIRSVGFVSGCLMYMRRDAIRKIGALDEEYHPMYFEDVAWHYTAHCHGLKTLYTPWSRIIHKEGSSAGTDVSAGMKRYQEINRKKFLEKFQGIDFEQFNLGR